MQTNKKMLKWTILLIAMVQMPTLAVGTALSSLKIQFPAWSVTELQTALQSPNLISPFISLAIIVITAKVKKPALKKAIIIFGLLMLVAAAVGMIFCHGQFYTLYLWGACIGIALGSFIPTTNSLLYDCFDARERRQITGFQTTFINGGGIIMSVLGGFLVNLGWYCGYFAFFLALPVIFMCIRYIPGRCRETGESKEAARSEKLNFDWNILYYAVIIFVFMCVYNVGSTNLSILVIDELNLGTAATAGVISAVQLGGGTVAGLFFGSLSKKLKDKVIALGFLVIAVAFTIYANTTALPLIIIAAFISGTSMSMVMPECSFAISVYANERTSTIASAFSWSFAPSLGGFFSAKIFTASAMILSSAVAAGKFRWNFLCFRGASKVTEYMNVNGDAVGFRYGYVAFVALVFAAAAYILAVVRKNSKINKI